MIEYASMEVSKLLVQAGFDKQPGADVDGFYTDEGDGLLKSGRDDPLPPLDQDGVVVLEHWPAYRADTLLSWLLHRGVSVTTTVGGGGFIYATVNYHTMSGDTVADALGKTVAYALGVEP